MISLGSLLRGTTPLRGDPLQGPPQRGPTLRALSKSQSDPSKGPHLQGNPFQGTPPSSLQGTPSKGPHARTYVRSMYKWVSRGVLVISRFSSFGTSSARRWAPRLCQNMRETHSFWTPGDRRVKRHGGPFYDQTLFAKHLVAKPAFAHSRMAPNGSAPP